VAGVVGPSLPFVASGEGPSLPFVSGGVGPRSPLVHGGVGPSLPFVPGGVGPSSLFGLGPLFAVHGAGGSSSCVDGAAGGSSFFVGGGAGGSSYCLWVVVVVVRPHGFSCAVWSCRHSRVRVVGGCLCLQALHLSSSSLASFLCAVVTCHPCRVSSASRVLVIIVCPRHVVVSCPPRRCPVLLSLPCPRCDMSFGCMTWHLC